MEIIKAGIAFLFGTFTHLIAIIIWNECIWNVKRLNGGVGGSPLSNINPVLKSIVIYEFLISVLLILTGVYLEKRKIYKEGIK